jgi:hypothetical protein
MPVIGRVRDHSATCEQIATIAEYAVRFVGQLGYRPVFRVGISSVPHENQCLVEWHRSGRLQVDYADLSAAQHWFNASGPETEL